MFERARLREPEQNRLEYVANQLLPEGSQVPELYRAVAAQLEAWGLPSLLIEAGLLLRAIERGSITPAAFAGLAGRTEAEATQARELAETLAEFGGTPARPALQAIAPIWRLFMVAHCCPEAGLLKIAELLAKLNVATEVGIYDRPETIAAAAHMSGRLGMWDVRHELLDRAAELDDPHLAQRARQSLDRSLPLHTTLFGDLKQRLSSLLEEHGVQAQLERRRRPLYKIIDESFDSTGRPIPWTDTVLVQAASVQDCYRALGAINANFPVTNGRLRDYIGSPKENGYQEIQTCIEFTTGERTVQVEIRIATAAMAAFNRAGFLAYLAGRPVPQGRPVWWAAQRQKLSQRTGPAREIFVFTPKGEPFFLPYGATVLDFAMRLHFDLGIFCREALVNGHRTLPGEVLESGDICEVLIDSHGQTIDPRLLDRVKTSHAKQKIRRALQKGAIGATRGRQLFRELLATRLEFLDIHADAAMIDAQIERVCMLRGYQTVDVFYRSVARGEVAPDQVIGLVVDDLLIPRLDLSTIPEDVRIQARRIRLAQCCWPHPGVPVVGSVVHRGRQIKIHMAGCRLCTGLTYPLSWKPLEDRAYAADVLYESWDRPGLIHQLTSALFETGKVNIRSMDATVPEPNLARIRFSFETPDRDTIKRVRTLLEQLPELRRCEVRAVTLVDDGFRITTPLENPYAPQPVGRWPLFVGRAGEVNTILAQLDSTSGAGHILIRGPKRIGKSSLLEHLSRYHLSRFAVPALLNLQSLPSSELRFGRLLARLAGQIMQQTGARAIPRALETLAFERDPIGAFAEVLGAARTQRDERFVVLIDELGVVVSRLGNTSEGREFFDQWRALLNDQRIYQNLAFVVAMPDATLTQLIGSHVLDDPDAPAHRLGELGHSIRLAPLDEVDARDLITTPVKTHLEYEPGDIERLVAATGGHPYYTHLVCSQIVLAVQARERRTGTALRGRRMVPTDVVDAALREIFLHRDAFFHIHADSSPATMSVLQTLAKATSEQERLITRRRLRNRLAHRIPNSEQAINSALAERPDLLVERDGMLGIRAGLVALWLRSQ